MFRYEVYNQARTKLMADGFTQHACVDGSGKPVAVPDWFHELFSKMKSNAEAEGR